MAIENYPLVSEYEIEIKKFGSGILHLEDKYEFVPCRTTPIKIFNYGSGTFAAVFKVRNTHTGAEYALRCFLNGGNLQNINRTFQITEYISRLEVPFLCKSKLFSDAINIKGAYYPIILMEWVHGKKLNDYVSRILHDNSKLSQLQEKLVSLSHSMELLEIAHGDIQSGNVLVQEAHGDILLKLVDYDPMFIPTLQGEKAYEVGHSSFQHPNRSKKDYNAHIDRFSFWLLLTAIEAIKYDKSLWNKDLKGGFNDEDNFLFKAKDLQYPQNSALVQRLKGLQQPSVNFYLEQLLGEPFVPQREAVRLFGITEGYSTPSAASTAPLDTPEPQKTSAPYRKNQETEEVSPQAPNPPQSTDRKHFIINSTPTGAKVYIGRITEANFKGITPLKLSLSYQSQKVILDHLGIEKMFYLSKDELTYNITLGRQATPTHTSYSKPQASQVSSSSSYKNNRVFTIDSIPQGATVYIDTQHKGITPLELPLSYQGHKVSLVYGALEKTFYLNNAQLDYQIKLEPAQNYTPPKAPTIEAAPTTEGKGYIWIVLFVIVIVILCLYNLFIIVYNNTNY